MVLQNYRLSGTYLHSITPNKNQVKPMNLRSILKKVKTETKQMTGRIIYLKKLCASMLRFWLLEQTTDM